MQTKSELKQNKVSNEEQLELVQTAVYKYREDSDELVPIKTKSAETDLFEKYLIYFNYLKEKNMITSIPGNAFESGGIYQYTLITPDEDRKSTRLNSSHVAISYAVFCLKKKIKE